MNYEKYLLVSKYYNKESYGENVLVCEPLKKLRNSQLQIRKIPGMICVALYNESNIHNITINVHKETINISPKGFSTISSKISTIPYPKPFTCTIIFFIPGILYNISSI